LLVAVCVSEDRCRRQQQHCLCDAMATLISWHIMHTSNHALYICPIWMWEAITCLLQPKPWHHGINFTRQWLIIGGPAQDLSKFQMAPIPILSVLTC
jgi:hypothetical protein